MALMDTIMNLVRSLMGGAGQQQQAGEAMGGSIIEQLLQNGVQGGPGALLQQLTQSGLGEQVQSWLSTGQNLPVSAEQIQNALQGGQLQQWAQNFGLSPETLSQTISQHLPGIIDRMSPNGRLPGSDQQ